MTITPPPYYNHYQTDETAEKEAVEQPKVDDVLEEEKDMDDEVGLGTNPPPPATATTYADADTIVVG